MFETLLTIFGDDNDTDLIPHPAFTTGDIVTAIVPTTQPLTGEFIGFTSIDGEPFAELLIGKASAWVSSFSIRPATLDEELDYRLMSEVTPLVDDVIRLDTGELAFVLAIDEYPYLTREWITSGKAPDAVYAITLLDAVEKGERPQLGKHYLLDWYVAEETFVTINDEADAFKARVEALAVVKKTALTAEAINAAL